MTVACDVCAAKVGVDEIDGPAERDCFEERQRAIGDFDAWGDELAE